MLKEDLSISIYFISNENQEVTGLQWKKFFQGERVMRSRQVCDMIL